MTDSRPDTVLLIASEQEYFQSRRMWGTGGWLPAGAREALDWFTLCRFMGWTVVVTSQKRFRPHMIRDHKIKWFIFACDPDEFDVHSLKIIEDFLHHEPALFVARAGREFSVLASWTNIYRSAANVFGRKICWSAPEETKAWTFRHGLSASILSMSEPCEELVCLNDAAIIAHRGAGRGKIALLGFHPSEARDSDPRSTALLKHLLSRTPNTPTVWFDWANTLILRMDDPGSAETVHHKIYSNNKLVKEQWEAIGTELSERHAIMTIGYVSGWVDDGNPELGTLIVNGASVERVPGKIFPSPLVRYESRRVSGDKLVYDYESEYAAISKLQAAGLVGVELHGYTHMFPDTKAWSAAPDRYTNERWYREFGRPATNLVKEPMATHPLKAAQQNFSRFFNTKPTSLICPGDVFTNEILFDALDEGLTLVSSYYLAIRDGNRFCWSQHICAPYLDEADATWFDSELPVVGYFHDFDISQRGLRWFQDCLDVWQESGADTIRDLGGMNKKLCHRLGITDEQEGIVVTISSDVEPQKGQQLEIFIRLPQMTLPQIIRVNYNDSWYAVDLEHVGDNVGRVAVVPD